MRKRELNAFLPLKRGRLDPVFKSDIFSAPGQILSKLVKILLESHPKELNPTQKTPSRKFFLKNPPEKFDITFLCATFEGSFGRLRRFTVDQGIRRIFHPIQVSRRLTHESCVLLRRSVGRTFIVFWYFCRSWSFWTPPWSSWLL